MPCMTRDEPKQDAEMARREGVLKKISAAVDAYDLIRFLSGHVAHTTSHDACLVIL